MPNHWKQELSLAIYSKDDEAEHLIVKESVYNPTMWESQQHNSAARKPFHM